MPDAQAWDAIRELNHKVSDLGQPFALTEDVRALLRDTAPDVAITAEEAAEALQSEASTAALLVEIARRIREGSHRLSRMLGELDRRQQTGDADGARQLLLDVLAVEVVPHYRDIIHTYLAALDEED
ncbi:DUSAM domain-containing protein [Corallococcus llansteffanensis]|uniref:DUSAM domain-containing protein n=1 Tax=Corallococcus llansteffanensis TaxID=2316731 RepID=A0A3A8PU89_9BACT|nr:DUSAM domain-containing protein [Corallococcus llansteffanensis]RKH55982.1 DUSAM domain-containing protein [Corallococcus llansteffanensis]